MNLSVDSPELTAYALGELNPAERAEAEAALDASPELRAELAAIRRTIGALDFGSSTESAALSPEQRAAIVAQMAAEAPRETASDAAGHVATSLTGSETEGHSTKTAADPTWESERHAPDGWGRLLAWRRQLIWLAAGACALAFTLLFWPMEREGSETEDEWSHPGPQGSARANPSDGAGVRIFPMDSQASVTLFDWPPAPTAVPGRLETVQVPAVAHPIPTTQVQSTVRTKVGNLAASTLADPAQPRSEGDMRELMSRYGLLARGPDEVHQRHQSIHPVAVGEGYEAFDDNDFKIVTRAPLSTFSLDVDTASYANVRRFLREGSLPPRDAVRLEELINYFHYDYPQPKGEHPFMASVEVAESPWKESHKLVRIGLQARSLNRGDRPPANLVFLVDVSGSMAPENKLPLVKRSLRLLLDKLTERDRVGVVTYAAGSEVVAEPTAVHAAGKARLLKVIEGLEAGHGTHGSAGIRMAYAMATRHFNAGHVNRVLLCTDGDFNLGITHRAELLDFITERAKTGVFLSVLGYGMDNYQDRTNELLADKGNGNYAYVDSFTEARKVLSEQLEGTLVTVAKDVKVQVEFNPARVRSYRLLGYENRALKDRDFNDDAKDAGEVGAGHQVTVLYEVEPAVPTLAGVDPLRYQVNPGADGVKLPTAWHGRELLNLKVRYKLSDGTTSRLVETPVKDDDREFETASRDFRFAAAVAGYGMLLRQSPHAAELSWEKIARLAEQGLGEDREGRRAEFVDLVRRAEQLVGNGRQMPEPRPVPMPRR